MNLKTYQYLQNGVWKDAKEHIQAISPATLQPFASTPAMNAADVDESLAGSRKAFLSWAHLDYRKRIEYLEKIAALMEKDAPNLAELISTEVGKRKTDAMAEVLRSVEYIRQTNEEYAKLMANPLHFDESKLGAGKEATFLRVPLGVVLCISPFNYPVNLAISKIAPALVVGNTVAYKPATQGVATGLHMATYFSQAGLPAGVFNTIAGRGRDIGDHTTSHKEVDMIHFTGSTGVGNNIAKLAPRKPLVLELGGKDFAIVRPDADLPKTVKEIVKGAFSYSGQRCTAIKRVFVTPSNKQQLEQMLVQEINALSVGMPADDAFVTPVIDLKAADFLDELVKDAVAKGGKVLTGNKRQKNLYWPTLITEVTVEQRLAWEEPFGPLLPIITVKDDAEAIKLSNDSEYGLQGSIFTKDIAKAKEMALHLDTGSININQSSSRGPDIMPFIGVKNSGFGVQGIYDSLLSTTRYKGIVIKK